MTTKTLTRAATLVCLVSFLAGCGEGILEVNDPDIVTPDNLLDETGLDERFAAQEREARVGPAAPSASKANNRVAEHGAR